MADVKDILIRYGVDPGNSTKAMNDIAKASAVAGGALDKTGMSMKTNTQLGMNFNRVLQDSPYFFSSFNMGVMSVSNNLPMLAESFQAARMRGESFKQMLSGMFMGMGGWMTALNLVISGILAYTMATREAKEESGQFRFTLSDLTGVSNDYAESLKKVRGEASQLTKTQLEDAMVRVALNANKAKRELNSLISIQALLSITRGGDLFANLFGKGDAATKEAINNIVKFEGALKEIEAIYDKPEGSGAIRRLQKEIDDLKETMQNASEDELPKYRKELELLQNRLDGLWGRNRTKTEKPAKKEIKLLDSSQWSELEEFGNKYRETQAKNEAKQAESEAKLAQQKQTAIDNYYNTVKFADEDYYNYRRTKLNEELAGLQELGIAEEDLDILRKQRLDELESEKMASLRRVHQFENNFANAASATLRTGMNQAFDDIFGHANSLLEIFLQNLVSGMATDLATQAGEGIFSWLTGGASSIFSLFGFSKGDSRGDDSKQVINVNIDSQKVAQIAVKPYLKESVYELNRTGRW